MQIPQPIPAASDWYLADFDEQTVQSKPAAGGIATATLSQTPPGEAWEVDRITVACTSTQPTSCLLYDGLSAVAIEGTVSGNFDVADESSPVRLLEGAQLQLIWSNASNGAVGTARVQYRINSRQSQAT
jgi:hypothetical protein